jgi:hypothetical protein
MEQRGKLRRDHVRQLRSVYRSSLLRPPSTFRLQAPGLWLYVEKRHSPFASLMVTLAYTPGLLGRRGQIAALLVLECSVVRLDR